MFTLFRAVADRVKAMFLADAALDLEAEFVARNADRKAHLLQQADTYEEQGLHGVARELRQHADGISLKEPLAGILPAVNHLLVPLPGMSELPALTGSITSRDAGNGDNRILTHKKGKKQ